MKKKIIISILAVIMLAAGSFALFACTRETPYDPSDPAIATVTDAEAGFTYELHKGGTAWLVGVESKWETTDAVVVPEKIGDRNNKVVSLAKGLFKGSGTLVSIELPESLQNVGEEAFKDCKKLVTARFKSSDTVLGKSAFENCEALKELTLPAALKSVPETVFKGAFATYPTAEGSTGYKVILPDTVKQIGVSAFENARFGEMSVPAALESVADRAFFNANSWRYQPVKGGGGEYAVETTAAADGKETKKQVVTFPEGLKKIGRQSFSKVSNIRQFVLPLSLTEIGGGAFSDNYYGSREEPTIVTAKRTVQNDKGEDVEESVNFTYIYDAHVLLNVEKTVFISQTYSNSQDTFKSYSTYLLDVIEILPYAMGSCTYATRMTIPAGIMKVGESAFGDFSNSNMSELRFEIEAGNLSFPKSAFKEGATLMIKQDTETWTNALAINGGVENGYFKIINW